MAHSRKITIEKVMLTSFTSNLVDLVFGIIVLILTGSITIFSQTLEALADLISSSFLLIGTKRSSLPPDHIHPYGYGRETYLWAHMAGLVTFGLTATLSVYFGYKRLVNPEQIEYLPLALSALVVSLFSNSYSLFVSYRKLLAGKRYHGIIETWKNSPLIEVKTSFVLDLMGSVAASFGFLALAIYYVTGNQRFDGIGAIITGFALAFFSYFILKGSKDLLIGKSASPFTISDIKKAIYSFKEVQTIEDIRVLIIGSNKLLISLELNLQDELTTDDLELLIDNIEAKINESVEADTYIQIELETPDN